ncbi:hypothetical protein WA026_006413 [Henosepilachna vigintioctopunctata]|uniref:Uncharacterized protein n=1 Tax=Henosepilachna vigintioctopunctata TaxID=420089 RepID=A0AAW1TIA8_9CUCU
MSVRKTMNLILIWSIFGLFSCSAANDKHENKYHVRAHHASRYHIRDHDGTVDDNYLPRPLPIPVPVSPPLANYNSLNLIFNLEKKTLAFANVSENVGFGYVVLDEGVLKLLVDAKTGTTLRYFHANDVTRIQTDHTKGDILNSLAIILKREYENESIPEGSRIDPSCGEALRILSNVYSHVASGHDLRSQSLKHFGKFVDKLEQLYLGPLKGILQGPNPVPLKQNLNRFLSISVGLRALFVRAKGGLKEILEKGVKFEVNPLYNAKNGAEVFVYILRQTGTKFNLAALWRSLLNNIEEVLHIIQLLGGGETTNGVDETFGFLSHIWAAVNLRLSIPELIKYLLQSSTEENWSKGDDGDFSNVLKDLKNITDEQAKKYDNSGLITPFVSFISNFTANSLIQDGVNVSELVEKWRKRDAIGGFKAVTEIILKITSPEKYSHIFFNSFIAFLNSSSDPNALKRLLPGVSVDQFTKGSSLWDSISKSFNIDNILKNDKNPNAVLGRVPGFAEFSKIYQESFGSPFNFAKILNGRTISEYLAKGFAWPFKWASDIFHIFTDPFLPFLPFLRPPPERPWLGPGPVISPGLIPSIVEESVIKTTKIIPTENESESSKVTESNSDILDLYTEKTSTEIKIIKHSTINSEFDESSDKGTETPYTVVKSSTEVDVEVSTELNASTEYEFKQHHHHNKHHQKKYHHGEKHENKNIHHGSKRHHDSKLKDHHEARSHHKSDHHQNRKNEKLEGRHAHHHIQDKEHKRHHNLNE